MESAKVMICYCGHDCARCKLYLATVTNDGHLRAEAAAYYRDTFGAMFDPAALRCMGGRSKEVFELCDSCPWMACCKDKHLSSCGECADYPCVPLASYIEKYVNKANQIP